MHYYDCKAALDNHSQVIKSRKEAEFQKAKHEIRRGAKRRREIMKNFSRQRAENCKINANFISDRKSDRKSADCNALRPEHFFRPPTGLSKLPPHRLIHVVSPRLLQRDVEFTTSLLSRIEQEDAVIRLDHEKQMERIEQQKSFFKTQREKNLMKAAEFSKQPNNLSFPPSDKNYVSEKPRNVIEVKLECNSPRLVELSKPKQILMDRRILYLQAGSSDMKGLLSTDISLMRLCGWEWNPDKHLSCSPWKYHSKL